jgi:hypothetical protein
MVRRLLLAWVQRLRSGQGAQSELENLILMTSLVRLSTAGVHHDAGVRIRLGLGILERNGADVIDRDATSGIHQINSRITLKADRI